MPTIMERNTKLAGIITIRRMKQSGDCPVPKALSPPRLVTHKGLWLSLTQPTTASRKLQSAEDVVSA
jgi:hypothetical protein